MEVIAIIYSLIAIIISVGMLADAESKDDIAFGIVVGVLWPLFVLLEFKPLLFTALALGIWLIGSTIANL